MFVIKLLKLASRLVDQLWLEAAGRQFERLFPHTEPGQYVFSQPTRPGRPNGVDFNAFSVVTRTIPGMISAAEAQALFSLSALGVGQGAIHGDIIEVGSWLGKSTVYLALGCLVSSHGLVHAVDTFEGDPSKQSLYTGPLKPGESIFERFQAGLVLAGVNDRVKAYPLSSSQARPVLKKAKVKARGVFIDACHDYAAVKQDIKLWQSAVVDGGFLVLHDYSSDFPGSVQAIDEFRTANRSFQVVVVIGSLIVFRKIARHRQKT
ncbi:MAG: hypothetical protein COU69_00020 [Candidatus Pacebacteria bacterium CG10_big_fil_rev_8_21_14_0_10_56_10]|nr:MAG: hypothetical protein COU69_00020 [Candidatus Pacebacteria bacterium CG10_big_fil_rev_8_21_14_0_10_56_10]